MPRLDRRLTRLFVALWIALLTLTSAGGLGRPTSVHAAMAPTMEVAAVATAMVATSPHTRAAFISEEAVVSTALRYLGYRYSYRGATPWTGFSCIGLAHWVYAEMGVNVPDELGAAWLSAPHITESQLAPGDLVYFANTVWAGLSHVGIYIGGGRVVAADNFQVGVRIDNIYDAYWSAHYYGATRPLARW